MVKEECSNLEWTIDCFMLTLFSVIAIICCHIFTMCFVYKEPPSKGLVGSEKDLTQTQDITTTIYQYNHESSVMAASAHLRDIEVV